MVELLDINILCLRLNSSNESKEWDFPFSNRLTAIVIMLIVFFIHFPSGSSESVVFQIIIKVIKYLK